MKRVGLIIILLTGFFYFSAQAQEKINLDQQEINDLIQKSKKEPLNIKLDELKKLEDYTTTKTEKMDQLYGNPARVKEFEKISKESRDLRIIINEVKAEQQKQQIIDRVVRVYEGRGLGIIIGKQGGQLLILTDANLVPTLGYKYSVEKIRRFAKFGEQLEGFPVTVAYKNKQLGLALLIGKSSWSIEEDLYNTISFQQINLLKRNSPLYLLQSSWDKSEGLEFLDLDKAINSVKLVKIDDQKELLIAEEGSGRPPEIRESFTGAPIFYSNLDGEIRLVGIRVDQPVPPKGLIEKFSRPASKKFYIIPTPVIKKFLNEASQELKNK